MGHLTIKEAEDEPDCSLPPVAQREFDRVKGILEARGTFSPDDIATIEVHAMAYDAFKESIREIKKHGTVAYTDRGIPFQHPSVGVMKTQELIILKCSKVLGLSPGDRKNIAPAKKVIDGSKQRFFTTHAG